MRSQRRVLALTMAAALAAFAAGCSYILGVDDDPVVSTEGGPSAADAAPGSDDAGEDAETDGEADAAEEDADEPPTDPDV